MSWLSRRKSETAIFAFGVLLRMSMSWNYAATWSYDAQWHWEVVEWIAKHRRVPLPETTFSSFHPPVYYSLAAWLTNHGVSRWQMPWVSIIVSCLELAIIWIGLELYVERSRLARLTALALAAVTAALVHIGGMVYPEALNCFWMAAVMLLAPLTFRRKGSDRWPLALLIGGILGIAMLTKVSTTAVILALGLAVGMELLLSRERWSERLARCLPWAGTIVVCLAICGWYFARNVREYGRPFVTSFNLPSQHRIVADAERKPLLDRRTLGFVLSWDESLLVQPFAILNYGAHGRMIPVAIASTFVDFWGYGFQGYEPSLPGGSKPRVPRSQWATLGFARGALVGGIVVFCATAAAWFAAFRRCVLDRDFARLSLLLVPLSTFIAALEFATECPADSVGVVKGVYMSFGAPPLYGLFGIAVGWAFRTRARLPLFAVLCCALWAVGAYSVYCRLGVRLLPL